MNRSWSSAAIEAATGIPAAQIDRVLADPASVSPLLASQVAVAYDALWNKEPPVRTPGERQAAHAARELAEAHGWPPPAAWDDDQIDQPRGKPAPGWRRTGQSHRAADMAEDVAFLRETGYRQAPQAVLAMRLGVRKATLERALIRHAHRTREADRQREANREREAEMEPEAG